MLVAGLQGNLNGLFDEAWSGLPGTYIIALVSFCLSCTRTMVAVLTETQSRHLSTRVQLDGLRERHDGRTGLKVGLNSMTVRTWVL